MQSLVRDRQTDFIQSMDHNAPREGENLLCFHWESSTGGKGGGACLTVSQLFDVSYKCVTWTVVYQEFAREKGGAS
jgi:hypothetical protein